MAMMSRIFSMLYARGRLFARNGEVDAAFSKLQEWYPQVVEDDESAVCFLLRCQKFIELVRVGALEGAVKLGRGQLSKFFGMVGFEDLVQDCVALLAYEQPRESFVGYLLDELQREIVADMVNAMILSTNPNLRDVRGCLHSYLERLLQQLTACRWERRSLNGDQGETFHLHRVLSSSMKANCYDFPSTNTRPRSHIYRTMSLLQHIRDAGPSTLSGRTVGT